MRKTKQPNYRYKVKLIVKSTNKKEIIEEVEALLFVLKESPVSCVFGGDSGTCYAEGDITVR